MWRSTCTPPPRSTGKQYYAFSSVSRGPAHMTKIFTHSPTPASPVTRTTDGLSLKELKDSTNGLSLSHNITRSYVLSFSRRRCYTSLCSQKGVNNTDNTPSVYPIPAKNQTTEIYLYLYRYDMYGMSKVPLVVLL